MSEVIIELFLLDNFCMTFLIIRLAGIILHKDYRKVGTFIACLLSGTIAAFALNIEVFRSIPAKLLTLAMICFLSFEIKSLSVLAKCMLSTALSTFMFGGAVFALAFMLGGELENGIIYAGDSLRLVIVGIAAALMLTRAIKWMHIHRQYAKNNVRLRLKTDYGEAVVEAKIDTGNMLVDPVSLRPVVVADYDKLGALFPKEWAEDWMNHPTSGMRLIPYEAIGSKGVLPAVKLYVTVIEKGVECGSCYLAAGKLTNCTAIINSSWIN